LEFIQGWDSSYSLCSVYGTDLAMRCILEDFYPENQDREFGARKALLHFLLNKDIPHRMDKLTTIQKTLELQTKELTRLQRMADEC